MVKMHCGSCYQDVPTEIFPNYGSTVRKYVDLPPSFPAWPWDVNAQNFGEKLAEAVLMAH